MGGNFAHFFSSTEMNGQRGGTFVKQNWQPGFIFIGVGPTEAGFY